MKYDLEFGYDKQELMLSYMLADESVFQRANSILKTKYFDTDLQPIVKYVLYHADKFNSLPNSDQIYAETGKRITQHDMTTQDSSWVLSNIEKFCQRQAIVHAVNESLDFIDAGNYGEVEAMVKSAVEVTLERDLGTNIFQNPRELMERIRQNKTVATGWKQFDEVLYGGLNKGELTIFAAGSGVGKSLVLQNLGLNWYYGTSYTLKNGDTRSFEPMHVVYLSFELSEELIARRMYTMIAGIPSYEMYKKMDDLETKVAMGAKKGGSFIVKYMPPGTNCNTIKGYLKEYEIQHGRKPDALLVDYMDLMHPNSNKVDVNNVYQKDKYVSEELRALLAEYDMLGASASQLGRGGMDEADQSQSMIQGGLSKIQTCDNLVSIFCSAAMRERGEYQFQFLKTRSSNGTHRKLTLLLDKDSLRLSNNDEDDDVPVQSVNDVKAALFGKSANGNIGLSIGDSNTKSSLGSREPAPAVAKPSTNPIMEKIERMTPPELKKETVSPEERLAKILKMKNSG